MRSPTKSSASSSTCLLAIAASFSVSFLHPQLASAWSYSTHQQQQQRTTTTKTATTRRLPFTQPSLGVRHLSTTLHASLATETEGDAAAVAVVSSSGVDPDDDDNTVVANNNVKEEQTVVVVAEGVVVAQFAGGLSAVRVLDDMTAAAASAAGRTTTSSTTTSSSAAAATGDDLQGRMVIFPNQERGVVVAHRPPLLFVYTTTTTSSTSDDDSEDTDDGNVQILNSQLNVELPKKRQTSDDADDNDNDKVWGVSDLIQTTGGRAAFSPIPQVKDISLINTPMLTGITMFDALSPIGRGQNMLFVGHSVDEMRNYAIDFLANQLVHHQSDDNDKDVFCIYAAIDNVDKVNQLLQEQGIRDSVQVVAPQTMKSEDGDKDVDEMTRAAEAVATAASACAIAEARALQQKNGEHAIVVVDTIDWHKKLWDGTTRVLVDVFGVDSVVQGDRDGAASSEMRAFFSSLIQRAAQYNAKLHGGSVTLLLLTQIPPFLQEEGSAVFEMSDFEGSSDKVKARLQLLVDRDIALTVDTLRKIDVPIPSLAEGRRRLVLQHVDDLISMTDGQIWLDEKLEASGQSPPMDPQKSITRVGIGADTMSRADAPALRRIAEGLRLVLSQAAHMEGAEQTVALEKQVRRQQALLLAMHQTSGTGGRTLSQSCATLLAASEGFLDATVDSGALAGTAQGEEAVQGLLQHLQSSIPDVMREVDETLDLSPENKETMSECIGTFMSISC